MDKRILTGVSIIIVLLLVVMGLYTANYFVEGNTVKVSGHVNNNIVTGWDLVFDDYSIQESSLFTLELFYMPWETKDVLVEVVLTNVDTYETYEGHTWIGTANIFYSSKPFTVNIDYVENGEYSGQAVLYEVEKDSFGIEKNRVKQKTISFEVSV